jgi:site-specific DNA-methyltransferase (cytosine-N4-specific)
VGDAEELLPGLPVESVDLVMTSPPFLLQRQKEYGNLEDEEEYVDWLVRLGHQVHRALKPTGSFVLDLGGAYKKGKPVMSLYNYMVLIRMCNDVGFHLAHASIWHNPAKLPSPIEWVNKRKIRPKDATNTVWWLAKTEHPKADITRVRTEYSARMKRLLEKPEEFYSPKRRPSGHDISERFADDKGGALPSNLLRIANTESNSQYLRCCRVAGVKPHPARYPPALPAHFVKMLTDEGDLVLDFFAGSDTTGMVAEGLGRRSIAIDTRQDYLSGSSFRFLCREQLAHARAIYDLLMRPDMRGVVLHELSPAALRVG